jgi:hypothetical protein
MGVAKAAASNITPPSTATGIQGLFADFQEAAMVDMVLVSLFRENGRRGRACKRYFGR